MDKVWKTCQDCKEDFISKTAVICYDCQRKMYKKKKYDEIRLKKTTKQK